MCLPETTMYKSKNQHVHLFRYGYVSIGFVLLVFIASFVGSCDEAERHKVLDYFFDGVPPRGEQEFESGFLDPNSQQFDQAGSARVYSG